MKRSNWVMAGALALALATGISMSMAQNIPGTAGKGPKLPNCPIMGEPIDFTVSAKTDKGPVYFCCAGCIDKFNKKPEKYAEKAAAQRTALKDRPKIQVICPVSGKAVDGKTSLKHEGQTVGFCCPNCPAKFQTDPAKYQAALANSYTYQTMCPVMDEEINPAASAVLPTGQTIYYCCPRCADKVVADPAKYAPKLAAMGINLNVKKILAAGKKGSKDHGDGHDHDHDHGG